MTAVESQSRNGGRSESGGEGRGNSVIVNVIDVLRCFTGESPLAGVTEIAEQVGLHKSSVSRILATLEQERIVERDERSRKYRLGMGLIAIAGPLLANLDVREIAYPFLTELSETSGETAVLNIWDGVESVSVEQIPSPHPVKHTSAMGSRYRTGLSATVQLFLSHEPETQVRSLLDSGRIEMPDTVDTAAYLERLALIRERGYAVNYGEVGPDEVGVAAPVFDHRGDIIACVMIAAPFYRITPQVLEQLSAHCVRTAGRISVRLGYQPADR
ncbi:IclR family transcriptional regulator [Glutamicibacter sp. MNS18]|uniref:IclR family transcriptional regulator n=1 Tax=Glutamicibacter sp. MNS18 TaxID=2989817 RepID=UPI002235C1A8|nr:IclR family transcriptional regulator [Glutamicibacter sp. MNS18]MCW4465795.1 IclR family transcriptional regulator [Glutamicibacter sp. MNS18]